MKTTKVYFISGLGADRRVFKRIEVPDFCEVVYLDWITPRENESLQSYAERLAKDINSIQPFALVGLSMGGMIASEIASRLSPVITILISSAPVSNQLPGYFRKLSSFRFSKVMPISLLKSLAILRWLISTENEEDKYILKQIIKDSDPIFIRWALEAIPNWKKEKLPIPYIHIHGTNDKVLPIRFTKATHIIRDGGHIMVLNRAAEINLILQRTLEEAAGT
jgi:pimeloyl-ACP methyl ester carboxylesterase